MDETGPTYIECDMVKGQYVSTPKNNTLFLKVSRDKDPKNQMFNFTVEILDRQEDETLYIEGNLYPDTEKLIGQLPNTEMIISSSRSVQFSVRVLSPGPSAVKRLKLLMFSEPLSIPKILNNKTNKCYINSALQVLFHIPAFRRLIYSIKDLTNNSLDNYVLYNLQKLFAQLQGSQNKLLDVDDLCRSFGWGADYLIYKNDAAELLEALFTRLNILLLPYPDQLAKLHQLFNIGIQEGDEQESSMCYTENIINFNEPDFHNLPPKIVPTQTIALALKNSFSGSKYIDKFPEIFMCRPFRNDRDQYQFKYEEEINLGDYSKEKCVVKYKLISLILYDFKTQHYSPMVKVSSKGIDRWYIISDASESAKQVSILSVVSQFKTTTLLIYAKIDKYDEIMKEVSINDIPDIHRNLIARNCTSETSNSDSKLYYYTEDDIDGILNGSNINISTETLHEINLPNENNLDYFSLIKSDMQKRNCQIQDFDIWVTQPNKCNFPATNYSYVQNNNPSLKNKIVFIARPDPNEPKEETQRNFPYLLLFVQYSAITRKFKFICSKQFIDKNLTEEFFKYAHELIPSNTLKIYYRENMDSHELTELVEVANNGTENEKNPLKISSIYHSFIFLQNMNDEEKSSKSDLSNEAMVFVRASGLCFYNVTTHFLMQNSIPINFICHLNQEVKVIKVPYEFKFDSRLKSIISNAFNIPQMESKTVEFIFADQRIQRPSGCLIDSATRVSTFKPYSSIFFSAVALKEKHFTMQFTIIHDPAKPTFRRFPVKSGETIEKVVSRIKEGNPGLIPEHYICLSRTWDSKFSLVSPHLTLRNDHTTQEHTIVIYIYGTDHEIKDTSKTIRCFKCLFGLGGRLAFPVSEPYIVEYSDDDTTEDLRNKILSKLDSSQEYEILIAKNLTGLILGGDIGSIKKTSTQNFIAIRDPTDTRVCEPIRYPKSFGRITIFN